MSFHCKYNYSATNTHSQPTVRRNLKPIPAQAETSFLLTITLIFGVFCPHLATAQETPEAAAFAGEIKFEVESRQAVELPGQGGRRLIIEQVKPPAFPARLPAAKPAPIDPEVRAARRAAWALEARKEHRILSLLAIRYENGLTFLQWHTVGEDGHLEAYQGWSQTDFRSLCLVHSFEAQNRIYELFSTVSPASPRTNRPLPGPLYFPQDSPGFIITKGDPTHLSAIEPMAALHEMYRNEGAALAFHWETLKSEQAAEAARLKANPPPVEDAVVRIWTAPVRRPPISAPRFRVSTPAR